MISCAPAVDFAALSDLDLTRRCAARDRNAIRYVIAANNQRLFRAAWSVLKNRSDAEEAVQAAYLSAFDHMATFEGRSALSTWLTRIVINEALGRRRADERRRHHLEEEGVAVLDDYREALMRGSETEGPDVSVAREQVRKLLEQAIGALPESFRAVFVLREVEGLTSEETAEILNIPVATVKTRLHRSRRRLQAMLAPELKTVLNGTFPFAGKDCAGMTDRVLAKLEALGRIAHHPNGRSGSKAALSSRAARPALRLRASGTPPLRCPRDGERFVR